MITSVLWNFIYRFFCIFIYVLNSISLGITTLFCCIFTAETQYVKPGESIYRYFFFFFDVTVLSTLFYQICKFFWSNWACDFWYYYFRPFIWFCGHFYMNFSIFFFFLFFENFLFIWNFLVVEFLFSTTILNIYIFIYGYLSSRNEFYNF